MGQINQKILNNGEFIDSASISSHISIFVNPNGNIGYAKTPTEGVTASLQAGWYAPSNTPGNRVVYNKVGSIPAYRINAGDYVFEISDTASAYYSSSVVNGVNYVYIPTASVSSTIEENFVHALNTIPELDLTASYTTFSVSSSMSLNVYSKVTGSAVNYRTFYWSFLPTTSPNLDDTSSYQYVEALTGGTDLDMYIDLTSVSTASYAGTSSLAYTASNFAQNETGFIGAATLAYSQSQAIKLGSTTYNYIPGAGSYLSGYPDLIGFQTGRYWYLNFSYPAPYVGDQTEICLYSGSYLIGYGFSNTTQGNYHAITMQVSSSTGWQNFGDWKYGNDAYGFAVNGGGSNWGGGAYIKDVIEATGSFVRIRWVNNSSATIQANTALLRVDIKQLDRNHIG